MSALGDTLTRGREKKGVSREAAAAATKIKIDYLRALEENLFDQLPPPAYVKGFLKIYARYLEMPAEPLLQAYDEVSGSNEPEMLLIPQRQTEAIPFLPRIKWMLILQAMLGAIVAALLAVGVIKLIRGEKIIESPSEGYSVVEDPYVPETLKKIGYPDDLWTTASGRTVRPGSD